MQVYVLIIFFFINIYSGFIIDTPGSPLTGDYEVHISR